MHKGGSVYFSDSHEIVPTAVDDWFDILLETDTQLFVDPFLIYAETSGPWADAGAEIAEHFQRSFEILAGHQSNQESLQYKKTVDLMLFPEPKEFGLGFVSKGNRGAGTGREFAQRIVKSMAIAIERGLQDLHHFEELGLLVENIGRDRISDIACNILKQRFITYTQEVCTRHSIQMDPHRVEHAAFDSVRRRWEPSTVLLPTNPHTGGPSLLVPKRFLRELPTLNSDDWWDYVEPTFRDDLNLDINARLRKADIVRLAQRNPDLVREWSTAREAEAPTPYDVDQDPAGLHDWQRLTQYIAVDRPLDFDAVTAANLVDFIERMNDSFRLFIEEEGGWILLRNDDTGLPKRETSIQLLYKGVVQAYCRAHGVRLDREVELGRGPVDFVFNSGRERVLLEIKKMRNGSYWNGLENQLLSYMTSDQTRRGWFLAIRLTDSKTEKARTADLPARTQTVRIATGMDIRSSWVDARPKVSASNLETGGARTIETAEDPEFPEEQI
jgi:hypothetical protein